MTYAEFPLSEIELSKLILIKEGIKKYREQDGSRWIFRSPGYLSIAGARDLYLKVWNSTYFRCNTILRGIETGFFDQDTRLQFWLARLLISWQAGGCSEKLFRPFIRRWQRP